ncbi:MAG: hypothetical protein V4850_25120 [Myxococcota bacterium]
MLLFWSTALAAPATVGELVAEMVAVAAADELAPAVRADWHRLTARLALADTPDALREYARVRVAFEATRDGGLWGLKWAITDREPTARFLWSGLLGWRGPDLTASGVTAIGECDELSAMFASLARAMGVKEVGLFWPTSNHTVAVWTAAGAAGPVRVVVPTSQVFLEPGETLGTQAFDARTQRTIYRYGTRDLPLGAALSPELADRLTRSLGDTALPAEELQRRRNARSEAAGGS